MSGRMAVGEKTSLSDRKRRAAQRMILGFDGTSAPKSLAGFCKQAPPAGFILFARNVEEPAQVCELNRELAQLLPDALPALLSVDQEGGRVMRIKATPWPPMRWLGNVDDVRLTREVARRMGLELAAMGFNLNWAPVADVDSNPKNPVIGDRSFSADPEVVARHDEAFLAGLHDAGLMGCIKHFPGHGDTATDSHDELPVVDKDRGDIERCELLPFQSMVSAGVEMVMTAHVMFPVLDEAVPATMSHPILQGWLRERLGHSGLVVSDDMEMGAVRGRFALEQQLDLACRASVDLFLFCRDPALQMEAWETLIRLQESDPTHDTLAADSSRRLMCAREAHLLNPQPPPMLASVGCQQHKDMARQIRERGEA